MTEETSNTKLYRKLEIISGQLDKNIKRIPLEDLVKSGALYALPVALGLAGLFFVFKHNQADIGKSIVEYIDLIIMFQSIAIILTISIFTYCIYFVSKAKNIVNQTSDKLVGQVLDQIISLHEPTIQFTSEDEGVGFDETCRLATSVLDKGLRKSMQNRSEGVSGTVQILMFGTASLSMNRRAYENASEETKQSAQYAYHRKLEACIATSNLEVIRYVRLFEDEVETFRHPSVLQQYTEWVDGQIVRLKELGTGSYKLYSLRRAPGFKAARSTIVTDGAFIDIFGSGKSAIAVNGGEVSQKAMNEFQKFVDGDGKQNMPSPQNQQNLEDHLEKFRSKNKLA